MPFVVAVVALVVQRPAVYFDGDPAVDELALMNATHFSQLVGNYSRYGWSHPGPAWFYALSGFYQALGSQTWSFVAAGLILNGVALALIVLATRRAGGLLVAEGAGLVLLGYLVVLGLEPFRDIWPPYAAILPPLLLLFVAVALAAGSNAALAWSAVAGSFAVQLHVGTTPAVGAAIATALAVRAVRAWRAPAERPRLNDLIRPSSLLAATIVVVMWIPPLIDELRYRPGNLSALWSFFTASYPKHRWFEAVSILGRAVSPWQWHSLSSLSGPDIAGVSIPYIGVAILYVAACVGLALAASLVGDRFGQSVGVILTVEAVTEIVSIRDIAGPVYSYLVLWMTPIPVLLALGWFSVLLTSNRWAIERRLRSPAGQALLVPPVAALSIVALILVLSLPPLPVAAPDTQQAWNLTAAALDDQSRAPVVIAMADRDTWVVAAGVGDQLAKHGWPVRVDSDWTFMFGRQAQATGNEAVTVTFVDRDDASSFASRHPEAQLIGQTDAHAIYLTRRT